MADGGMALAAEGGGAPSSGVAWLNWSRAPQPVFRKRPVRPWETSLPPSSRPSPSAALDPRALPPEQAEKPKEAGEAAKEGGGGAAAADAEGAEAEQALEQLRARVTELAAEVEPARREAVASLGTCIVWAKYMSYPWWPAQVVELASLPESGATFKRIADSHADDTVLVAFYGKKREYSWMERERMEAFRPEANKARMPTNKKHKHYKPIMAAVRAAEAVLRQGPFPASSPFPSAEPTSLADPKPR